MDRRARAELKRLFERAREPDSAPRKHHLVPRSYLERWAVDGRVRVKEADADKSYCVSPLQAARETDFYSLASPDINPDELPPLLQEVMLGEVEAAGKEAIDELLVKGPGQINPELRAQFAFYMALQLTRGRRSRRQQEDAAQRLFQLKFGEITDAGIRQRLGKKRSKVTAEDVQKAREAVDQLKAGTLQVRPQKAAMNARSAQVAYELGEHLLFRHWRVYPSPPILMTCDEPVLVLGGPARSRKEQAGVAVAAVIAFPLAPHAVLVMTQEPLAATHTELDYVDVAELNRELGANASRWIFERGDRAASLRLQLPPAVSEAVVAVEVPLVSEPNNRLVRSFQPTRWANEAHIPPWPVSWWWQSASN